MTGPFLPLDGFDGVYWARKDKLACVALRLRDDSLCLYSPIAGLEHALAKQSPEIGTVSALLAPNHYHNKGLAPYAAVFPDAALHSSDAARPRLTKITGLTFQSLEDLRNAVPSSVTLLEPEGLKTGEIWIAVTSDAGCALVVTDAFNSKPLPLGEIGQNATMLGTFPNYGVKDATTYKAWASEIVSTLAPVLLLPCHGSPVRAPDLTSQLIELLNTTF